MAKISFAERGPKFDVSQYDEIATLKPGTRPVYDDPSRAAHVVKVGDTAAVLHIRASGAFSITPLSNEAPKFKSLMQGTITLPEGHLLCAAEIVRQKDFQRPKYTLVCLVAPTEGGGNFSLMQFPICMGIPEKHPHGAPQPLSLPESDNNRSPIPPQSIVPTAVGPDTILLTIGKRCHLLTLSDKGTVSSRSVSSELYPHEPEYRVVCTNPETKSLVMWVAGKYSLGCIELPSQTNPEWRYTPITPPTSAISGISTSPEGDLAVWGAGGLFLKQGDRFRRILHADPLPTQSVTAMFKADDSLQIATNHGQDPRFIRLFELRPGSLCLESKGTAVLTRPVFSLTNHAKSFVATGEGFVAKITPRRSKS